MPSYFSGRAYFLLLFLVLSASAHAEMIWCIGVKGNVGYVASDFCFKNGGKRLLPPSAPGQFSGSSTAANSISLTWLAASGRVTTYDLVRRAPDGSSKKFQLAASALKFNETVPGPGLYVYQLSASNEAGPSAQVSSQVLVLPPPVAFAYLVNPATYTKGLAISANSPNRANVAGVTYAATPALPSGLSISPTTGTISGTPNLVSRATSFRITATNVAGQTSTSLTISVNDIPPAFRYSVASLTLRQGTAMTAQSPVSSGGGVDSYSVAPALPAGISLNPTTGTISGTPSAPSGNTSYVVTGINSAGRATATLALTVNPLPPVAFSYPQSRLNLVNGLALTNFAPTNANTPGVKFSASPDLPKGLVLDAATGTLSGTPALISPLQTYKITASNVSGSTFTPIAIYVKEMAPRNLSYAFSTWIPTSASTNKPTSEGGKVTAYIIQPALPQGFSLDGSTGILSGTPGTFPAKNYTIIAINSAGSTCTDVVIGGTFSNSIPNFVIAASPGQPRTLVLPFPASATQAISFRITSDPTRGKISGAFPNLIYTADPGPVGQDAFQYQIDSDGKTLGTGSVSVNILPSLVVTTSAPTGPGSLADALAAVNKQTQDDSIKPLVISFKIGSGGKQVIAPTAELRVSRTVIIDGTTQPGYSGSPLIGLDFSRATRVEFRISADNTVIRGIAVYNADQPFRVFGNGVKLLDDYGNLNLEGVQAGPSETTQIFGNANLIKNCSFGLGIQIVKPWNQTDSGVGDVIDNNKIIASRFSNEIQVLSDHNYLLNNIITPFDLECAVQVVGSFNHVENNNLPPNAYDSTIQVSGVSNTVDNNDVNQGYIQNIGQNNDVRDNNSRPNWAR